MIKSSRLLLTLVVAVLVGFGLAACGGTSDEVVARVGSRSITKSMLDHWTHVEAILLHQQMPTRALPRGVVPDPPLYTACISYLRSTPWGFGKSPNLTNEQLRVQCRKQYMAARQTALSFLITWDWLISEGKERGLTAPDGAIRRRFEMQKNAEFAHESEFQRHLAITGETLPDRLLRAKAKLFSEELERKLTSGLNAKQLTIAAQRFAKEFPKKWVARTSCRAGYIVPICKQYRGPLPPEPVI
jgi:hypothetical protein